MTYNLYDLYTTLHLICINHYQYSIYCIHRFLGFEMGLKDRKSEMKIN